MTSFSLTRREFVLPKAFSAAIAERKTVTRVFDIASEPPGRPNTLALLTFGLNRATILHTYE